MPLNIIIREACESDLLSLVKYNLALAMETENLDLNKDTLRVGIQNSFALQGCHYFVAETEGNVVGQTMITSEWSDWRNGTIWWMQSVYVHPNYRKQGIFNRIFKHIEAIAATNPAIQSLRLYVMKNNQAGLKTYQSVGMSNSGYLVYEKPLQPFV